MFRTPLLGQNQVEKRDGLTYTLSAPENAHLTFVNLRTNDYDIRILSC